MCTPAVGQALYQAVRISRQLTFFFCLFRAKPEVHGGSQARGLIGAVATGHSRNHSHARSKPHLRPTPQLTATSGP